MRETGQIYMPVVNWGLFVAIVLAVVMFRSSQQPGLGLRHRGDDRHADHHRADLLRDPLRAGSTRWALCIAATGFFFVVDVAFFASNLLKLFDGGWFPLLIGGGIFTLMMTWKQRPRSS